EARRRFAEKVRAARARLIALTVELIQAGSENPPGDTGAVVGVIEKVLAAVPGLTLRRVTAREPVANLVARLPFANAGRRLVFSGHLDTFPVGDAARWSTAPLGGAIADGKIYGRGASDMKAGLAAAVLTAALLANEGKHLAGELVLALAGDEETGGTWGTKHLLAQVPEVKGDAMMCGDAGSPRVVRFGEKGQIWLELGAVGIANHGAHVHLGINAIERLMAALARLMRLRELPCPLPEAVRRAILAAEPVSEAVSGAGEAETLRHVTLNVGTIEGGRAVNLIPDAARARIDIRLPPGLDTAAVLRAAAAALDGLEGIESRVLSASEPNVTDPEHEIARLAAKNGEEVLGDAVVRNMRVGFSDSRFFREAGVPAVVYGPTPYNMGGADEHVTIDDVFAVFYVHALTAFDYLARR
ncbi:MAG TPA: M20/M25/M40 family metallo-hydrolase, partial [Alphaproteobacteria bacterium]|nr:M20/M25/M40 family metallo-hydrolase [Alphaproteobacteria bacterium]